MALQPVVDLWTARVDRIDNVRPVKANEAEFRRLGSFAV